MPEGFVHRQILATFLASQAIGHEAIRQDDGFLWFPNGRQWQDGTAEQHGPMLPNNWLDVHRKSRPLRNRVIVSQDWILERWRIERNLMA
jgi:hypothetical protein